MLYERKTSARISCFQIRLIKTKIIYTRKLNVQTLKWKHFYALRIEYQEY